MELVNDRRLTIARLAPLVRKRKVSPVELTKAFLERIAGLDPQLNAFITVTADAALEQARGAEREIARGRYRGALHGMPFALKDIFCTEGVRTTAGSRILRRYVPRKNAAAVDRLRAAGAVIVGKTNLHEFAYGVTNDNPHFGPVRNPWNPDKISGGSSGGSAASVAAALCLASLGTDTGGSVRIPAAACGCVGLKPTYGRVPLEGVIPLAGSLDHVGPICRCVEDAALVLQVIADAGPGESFTRTLKRGVRGLRVGLPRQYFFRGIRRAVRERVLEAAAVLEKDGAAIREVRLRRMDWTSELAGEITAAEAMAFHSKWLERRPGDYSPDIRERMLQSRRRSGLDYLLCQQRRRDYAESFERVLADVDVLIAPTLPVTAPDLGAEKVSCGRSREDVRMALLRLTRPANLTGLPAISVPCGLAGDGLPVGLQIMGRRLDESTVLRVSFAFERARPWRECFPPSPAAESKSP